MILTFLLAVLGAALLFLPRFVDMSDFTGVKVVGGGEEATEQEPGFYCMKAYFQADCLQASSPTFATKISFSDGS